MNLATIIVILQKVAAILGQFGPLAAGAIAAFEMGGWAGLEAYLTSLLTPTPPVPVPPPAVEKVKAALAVVKDRTKLKLKAGPLAADCCDACECIQGSIAFQIQALAGMVQAECCCDGTCSK